MSGKWTPGPWEFEPETEHHGAYVTALTAGTVCDCYWINRHGDLIHHAAETREYNARLIAAAPELAESLEVCLEYTESIQHESNRYFSAFRRARAALAKAKGEGA